VEGVTAITDGESYTHYDYVFGGEIHASVSIDTDIDVVLV
jgi:hypothetical protein